MNNFDYVNVNVKGERLDFALLLFHYLDVCSMIYIVRLFLI